MRETWYDKPNGNTRAHDFKPSVKRPIREKQKTPWVQNGIAIIALLLAGMALGYCFHPAINSYLKTVKEVAPPAIQRILI